MGKVKNSNFDYSCPVYRAKAPLRLGLAGGGTDVAPYCDNFGGAVLNIAINRFAEATLILHEGDYVEFVSHDLGTSERLPLDAAYSLNSGLILHRALYNKIIQDFNDGNPIGLTVLTDVDCPRGAGLGASSSLVVAMLEAYRNCFSLPLGEYDVAHYAYDVERIYAGMSGGAQDQYAATFGGINFMEFASKRQVIVNPLNISRSITNELETRLLLYFTGISRDSSLIIDDQVEAVRQDNSISINAMHHLKRDALEMKAALLMGNIDQVGEIMNHSWLAKKETSSSISNSHIDSIYEIAIQNGAQAGKISGAGGGGFMIILVDPIRRRKLQNILLPMGGELHSCNFCNTGAYSWKAS